MLTLILAAGFILAFCLAAAGLIVCTLHNEDMNRTKPSHDLGA